MKIKITHNISLNKSILFLPKVNIYEVWQNTDFYVILALL